MTTSASYIHDRHLFNSLHGLPVVGSNLLGRENRYNPVGHRSIAVLLPNGADTRLREEGWNVKPVNRNSSMGRFVDSDGYYYLNVKVPMSMSVSSIRLDGKAILTGQQLDHIDFARDNNVQLLADIEFEGVRWHIGERDGISAILTRLEITTANRLDGLE